MEMVMTGSIAETLRAGPGGCAPTVDSNLHMVLPGFRGVRLGVLERRTPKQRHRDDAIGWAVPVLHVVNAGH